ncbi:MAG: HEAT repeat domain-containing protein [Nocardioides sp.]
MGALPAPADLEALPRELVAELRTHLCEQDAVDACVALLQGAAAEEYADLVPFLSGRPGVAYFQGGWPAYWLRVWGARGLLYVWQDDATAAVLAGLQDPAWRVAEMCLKVSARRALPAGDGAVRLAQHELPRVRAATMRALAVAGDVEHVDAVADALTDESEEVRRAAARAFDAMRGRLDLPAP